MNFLSSTVDPSRIDQIGVLHAPLAPDFHLSKSTVKEMEEKSFDFLQIWQSWVCKCKNVMGNIFLRERMKFGTKNHAKMAGIQNPGYRLFEIGKLISSKQQQTKLKFQKLRQNIEQN